MRKEEGSVIAATIQNESYGPHERNVFDLYMADSKEPTPLLFLVHGGGFKQGDKDAVLEKVPLKACIEAGISVSTTNYRLTDTAPFPAPMHDAARALQHIRANAQKWNIDKTRVAGSGGSAGAGITQWLAYHTDLADPTSEDPIARESTRLSCIIPMQAQSTYDSRIIREIVPGDAYDHVAMKRLFGLPDDFNWNNGGLSAKTEALIAECGPITLLKEDAPPMLVKYKKEQEVAGNVHHPNFGKHLKARVDAMGVPCRIVIDADYEDGVEGFYRDYVAFLKEHLGV